MKWTPDTHQIRFDLQNGIAVGFETDVPEWQEMSPVDLHAMVMEENRKVNSLEGKTEDEIGNIKDSIISGEVNLDEII